MKVLIVKLSSLGDVVHALPVLKSLKDGLGARTRIDWLVEEPASGALYKNPLIDNVIVLKKRAWTRDFSGSVSIAKRLAKEKYDLVVDLQGLFKSGIWVALTRSKRRVGFYNARELSHVFLTEKFSGFTADTHAVDRYLALARHAGGASSKAQFILTADSLYALKALRQAGLKEGERYFVIVARARWRTKLWDDSRFVETAKEVYKRYGLRPVIVGGTDEKDGLKKIADGIGGIACDLSGFLNISALAGVMKEAAFALCVDTGPMHVASAVGCRVVALFGPTSHKRTGPYGEGHVVVRKGLSCSPCFNKICADPKCMTQISVEDALVAIGSLGVSFL